MRVCICVCVCVCVRERESERERERERERSGGSDEIKEMSAFDGTAPNISTYGLKTIVQSYHGRRNVIVKSFHDFTASDLDLSQSPISLSIQAWPQAVSPYC